MTTYRELVYMCLDLVKGYSDDFSYTEDHIVFLLDKYRALLLKQRYGNDPKKYIPITNYNNIKVTIKKGKSESLPPLMNIGIPRITVSKLISVENAVITNTTVNDPYYSINAEYVPKERFPFVGNNTKYLKNIKYFTIDANNQMLFKGTEDVELVLTAVLESPLKDDDLNSEFPLEESLIPNLIQMVLKDLLPASYRPEDNSNNATDDMATLAGYLSRVLKKPYYQNLTVDDTEDE